MARKPPQPLPRMLGAEEIMPTILRHIEDHRNLLNNITESVSDSTACFDNVIRLLAELENARSGEEAIIDALKYCSPSRDCQHAVEEAEEVWQNYMSVRRRDVYVLVRAVKERKEMLDEESQKLLDRILLEFEEYGYGFLDDPGIQRRLERVNRIEQLCTKFNRNLREQNGGEFFTRREVDGLEPKDLEPVGADGKAFYSHGKSLTIMRFAHNPETRKRMFLSSYQSYAENAPLFREIILLRDENARELGAKSHAATKIPYRAAESTEWVEELINDISETLLPFGRAEYEMVRGGRLQCIAADADAKIEDETASIPPWDYLYYSILLDKKARIDNHSFAINEYFPLHHTFIAMLDLFADYLQFRVEPIAKEDLAAFVWHESVQGWAIWDERPESKGDFVGYLFADLLSRPGKYKGNQSVNLQPGYLKPDGTRVYPINTLMCGLHLSPTSGYLLSHYAVVTLFHELGHSMHDLLARTKNARFHGYNVAPELGEGIAMMLEQFCWLPEVLKSISRHYTRIDSKYMDAWLKENPGRDLPPERIPEKLLEHRLTDRANGKIFKILGILITVMFDLTVHNPASRDDLLQLDEAKAYRDLFEKFKFRRLPDRSWAHVDNGALISDYDGGYYSYVCAEIFAADLFQDTFAENPQSREAWHRFRRGILEHGGSRDELAIIEEYLGGRRTNPDALLAMLGIRNRPTG